MADVASSIRTSIISCQNAEAAAVSPPKKGQAFLETSQGNVDIDKLEIPSGIKALLKDLDFDGVGRVEAFEFQEVAKLLKKLKANLQVKNLAEMESSMELVMRLLEDKKMNKPRMEYGHLPEDLQKVFRTWDVDSSGHVDESELNCAANAWVRMQEESAMMKKLLIGALIVVVVMFIGMFAMGMVTAELSKEFKASDSAAMVTLSGNTVQTESADQKMDGGKMKNKNAQKAECAAGQTCNSRRDALGGSRTGDKDDTVQVAIATSKDKLSSTLPDSTFLELKSLALSANNGNTLKLEITNFRRVKVRSSLCGSVVKLETLQGELTLDDYNADADPVLMASATKAGMAHIFRNGSPLSASGRRLAATDGMLEGFFNLLDDIEWTCTSQPLVKPDIMGKNYLATVKVKTTHEDAKDTPSAAQSENFQDSDYNTLDIAGVVRGADGAIYKEWDEEMLVMGDTTSYFSTFAMMPYSQELRYVNNKHEMKMIVDGGVAYDCRIEETQPSIAAQVAGSNVNDNSLEFMGVVEEDGMILRHFRLHMLKQSMRIRRLAMQNGGYVNGRRMTADDTQKQTALYTNGVLPNYMDYFDVDSDSSGVRTSGDVYRIRFGSTVKTSTVFMEKTFLKLTPLPAVLDLKGILARYGVTKFSDQLNADVCDTSKAPAGRTTMSYLEAAKSFPADTSEATPPFGDDAWSESMPSSTYYFNRLSADQAEEYAQGDKFVEPRGYKVAKRTKYWLQLQKHQPNSVKIMAYSTKYDSGNYTEIYANSSDDARRRLQQEQLHEGDDSSRRLGVPVGPDGTPLASKWGDTLFANKEVKKNTGWSIWPSYQHIASGIPILGQSHNHKLSLDIQVPGIVSVNFAVQWADACEVGGAGGKLVPSHLPFHPVNYYSCTNGVPKWKQVHRRKLTALSGSASATMVALVTPQTRVILTGAISYSHSSGSVTGSISMDIAVAYYFDYWNWEWVYFDSFGFSIGMSMVRTCFKDLYGTISMSMGGTATIKFATTAQIPAVPRGHKAKTLCDATEWLNTVSITLSFSLSVFSWSGTWTPISRIWA